MKKYMVILARDVTWDTIKADRFRVDDNGALLFFKHKEGHADILVGAISPGEWINIAEIELKDTGGKNQDD